MGNEIGQLKALIKQRGKTAVISGIFLGIRKEVRKRTIRFKPEDRQKFAQVLLKEYKEGEGGNFKELLDELNISDEDILFHINDGIDDGLRELAKIKGKQEHPEVGRNAPCPCGSGKKYKKCCL